MLGPNTIDLYLAIFSIVSMFVLLGSIIGFYIKKPKINGVVLGGFTGFVTIMFLFAAFSYTWRATENKDEEKPYTKKIYRYEGNKPVKIIEQNE